MGVAWTTHEIKLLIEMHRERYPTTQEMVKAFPRHTLGSVQQRASVLHLRKTFAAQRLIQAHLYFARREAETRLRNLK